MRVEKLILDPDTRRARGVVRITFGDDAGPATAKELEIVDSALAKLNDGYLVAIERGIREFMERRGWPTEIGRYCCNGDGSRWERQQPRSPRPDWASASVSHPASLTPERSAENDAYLLLSACDNVRRAIAAEEPAATVVEKAIHLGMLNGRWAVERQFGRAVDVGISRILNGRAGGNAKAKRGEFTKDQRLGAFRRAMDAQPTAGPSAWAREVQRLWPGSSKPMRAALKFFERNEETLRQ